ncbi:RluA family pseudouridine synthase [Patescibacteria group bacterium]|nr:RluA family pseudouridine synthase [Patescibacteria group bacterium]
MPNIEHVFEDESLLVVNKPSGLIVNRAQSVKGYTLQDYIESLDILNLAGILPDSEYAQRSGVLHRLDKDTSGLLLVAKNSETFEFIKAQFKNRSIKKEYLGLIHGRLPDIKVKVDAPIKRDPHRRFKMAVHSEGREAVTEFEEIKQISLADIPLSLIKAYPRTGRTHQIRIHLSALNCPIVADPIYSSLSQFRSIERLFPRLMLHALSLEFVNFSTKETVKFEASLPQEFTNIV